MSSKPFGKVLHLKLRSSVVLAAVLASLHLGAIASLVVVAQVSYTSLLLVPLLVYSAIYYFRRHILFLDGRSVISVAQSSLGEWSLRLANGKLLEAELCDDSYVHPLLVVLNFKTNAGSLSVPILYDALEVDQHRRLRSRLKLSKPVEREKLFRH